MASNLRFLVSCLTFLSVVPAIGCVLLLSGHFGAGSGLRAAVIQQAEMNGAAELSRIFAPPVFFGATGNPVWKLDEQSCAVLLSARSAASAAVSAVVYRDGIQVCADLRDERLSQAALTALARDAERRLAAQGTAEVAFVLPDSGRLVVGRKFDTDGRSVAVFVAAKSTVSNLLLRTLSGAGDTAALTDGRDNILAAAAAWPAARPFLRLPVAGTNMTLLYGRPRDAFWAGWRASLPEIVTLAALLAVLAVVMMAIRSVDRSVLRWISYLSRIAEAHSQEQFLERFRCGAAPVEISALGLALNAMAEKAVQQRQNLQFAVAEQARLLRELHHRVKNNFQVIESLLSLQKRSLPAHQLGDIHFIEDHILSMVVADRIAFTTQQGTFVSVAKLLPDVVDGLGRAVRNFAASVQLKVDLRRCAIGPRSLNRLQPLPGSHPATLPQEILRFPAAAPRRDTGRRHIGLQRVGHRAAF